LFYRNLFLNARLGFDFRGRKKRHDNSTQKKKKCRQTIRVSSARLKKIMPNSLIPITKPNWSKCSLRFLSLNLIKKVGLSRLVGRITVLDHAP